MEGKWAVNVWKPTCSDRNAIMVTAGKKKKPFALTKRNIKNNNNSHNANKENRNAPTR